MCYFFYNNFFFIRWIRSIYEVTDFFLCVDVVVVVVIGISQYTPIKIIVIINKYTSFGRLGFISTTASSSYFHVCVSHTK